MIDLNKAVPYTAPFPMLRMDDCLDEETFSELLNEFPNEVEIRSFEDVNGGRRRLSSDQAEFYRFLAGRPAWRRFYDFVNSEEFVNRVLEAFRYELDQVGSPLFEPIRFDQGCLRRHAEKREGNPGRKSLPHRMAKRLKDPRVFFRSSSKLHQSQPRGDELYLHFDISAGYNGYTREIHRDLDNRVAAFLVYFSDADETLGEGGEFCIHKLNGVASTKRLVRQPSSEDMMEVSRIRPKKNLFLMFLSTPNSYHSVPRITGALGPRKFIYVAITAKRNLQWPDGFGTEELQVEE